MYRETVDRRLEPQLALLAVRIAVLLLCSALWASAAPDPDLFDGRQAAESAQEQSAPADAASGGGEQTSESSEESSGGGAGAESASSGQPDTGEPVSSQSSKTGETGAGGGSEAQTAGNQGAAGGASAEGGEPASGRDFSSFGFGGGGTLETVDVNRSKSGPPSTPATNPSTESSAAEQEGAPTGIGQNQSGGSQPAAGAAAGDYGTNVPTGL